MTPALLDAAAPAAASPAAVGEALGHRYATKRFDPGRAIPAGTWEALEQALVLSPSSYGLQPWKFIVVDDPGLRRELVAATWNQPQPVEASRYVVLAVREDLAEADADRYLARIAEVRGVPAQSLAGFRGMLLSAISNRTKEARFEWNARQACIAMGQFMAAAAFLGVDTCPLEGLLPAEYDRILGLEGSGYRTVAAVAAGYRSPEDKYADLPKVRFEARDVVVHR
ncbi:MAG: NAD(P)H-dependent oxidoreductase [Holophagaceae bacterium]